MYNKILSLDQLLADWQRLVKYFIYLQCLDIRSQTALRLQTPSGHTGASTISWCHHSDQGLCQSPDILAGGSDGLKLKSRWDDLVVYVVVPCYCQVVHGLQQQVCEIFFVNVSLLVGSAHVDNYHAQNVLKWMLLMQQKLKTVGRTECCYSSCSRVVDM